MKVRDITMTADQHEVLRLECNVGEDREGASQMLCGSSAAIEDPWNENGDAEPETRLTLHTIDRIPPNRQTAGSTFVSWDMNCYVRLLRRAREEGLHPGICHSHPGAGASFSRQDDENENHLHDVLRRRNRDPDQVLISLLFRGEKWVDARVWGVSGKPQPVPVRVLGKEFLEASAPAAADASPTIPGFLHRQGLAMGTEALERLRRLRVGIVGCGGTGSAVATLLARAGVGRLLLIDPKIADETNLHRLHGSTRAQVKERRPKVRLLRKYIQEIGLGTEVAIRRAHAADAGIAKLLRACNVVFGCTDDHLGRLLLNRLAYFYYVPVIDTGLAVSPAVAGRTAPVSGRVTLLRPGAACLLCRGIVNPTRAREEGLRLKQPDEYARQVKEGYITGSDTPTPVVGSFTTDTACAAVNELLAGVAGLRGDKGWGFERTVRYDLDRCRPTGGSPKESCPICADEDYWGLADIDPFLDLAGV